MNNPRLNFVNPKVRYQTAHAGGVRSNPPYGLITGIPADIYTKYIPGTGVGSNSIFTRRAKLRRSVVCKSGCGKFIYPLDQPNYNVNGRGYELLAYQPKLITSKTVQSKTVQNNSQNKSTTHELTYPISTPTPIPSKGPPGSNFNSGEVITGPTINNTHAQHNNILI